MATIEKTLTVTLSVSELYEAYLRLDDKDKTRFLNRWLYDLDPNADEFFEAFKTSEQRYLLTAVCLENLSEKDELEPLSEMLDDEIKDRLAQAIGYTTSKRALDVSSQSSYLEPPHMAFKDLWLGETYLSDMLLLNRLEKDVFCFTKLTEYLDGSKIFVFESIVNNFWVHIYPYTPINTVDGNKDLFYLNSFNDKLDIFIRATNKGEAMTFLEYIGRIDLPVLFKESTKQCFIFEKDFVDEKNEIHFIYKDILTGKEIDIAQDTELCEEGNEVVIKDSSCGWLSLYVWERSKNASN